MVRGADKIQQVLVKWNNLPTALATWEDYEALRQEFPCCTAWGQAVSQGRGSVSNLPAQATATTKDGLLPSEEGKPGGRPKGHQPRKPNLRYIGREWAS